MLNDIIKIIKMYGFEISSRKKKQRINILKPVFDKICDDKTKKKPSKKMQIFCSNKLVVVLINISKCLL